MWRPVLALCRFSSFEVRSCRQESDFCGLAAGQSLLCVGKCRLLFSAQEFRVCEHRKIIRGSVEFLCSNVDSYAAFKNLLRLSIPPFIQCKVCQAGNREGCTSGANLL